MANIKQKKSYLKPEVTQIELKTEEIFLTNCKLSSGGATASGRASSVCSTSGRCRATTSVGAS